MFCGLLHHQKVVFVSGRCPFCTADEALPWEERMFEFDQTTHFSTHLEGHFAQLGVSTPCPHPRCGKSNKYPPAELREHLQDVHSLKHISRDQRGRPKMEGVVTTTKVRRAYEEAMVGMVGPCEEAIIDPLLLSLKASPVSQTSACNSSDSSSTTPQSSLFSMSMIASSCTTPVSTEAYSPTDYSRLATCIPFDPRGVCQSQAVAAVPERIDCSQPTCEIPPVTREEATVCLGSSKHVESSTEGELLVIEKLDRVTGDIAPCSSNIAASTDSEATALQDKSDVRENLSGVNLVRAGGSSGRQPAPNIPPVTRQVARERLKRKRSSAADSRVGAAVDVTLVGGDITTFSDKVEQPGLSPANGKDVAPKLRSPRHQPTRTTPPKTRQMARLEAMRSKRRRI